MNKKKLTIMSILAVSFCLTACQGGNDSHSTSDSSSDVTLTDSLSDETTASEVSPSAADETTEATQSIFAMDTYMTVTAYGANAEDAVTAGVAEIERLDALLSTGNADSEVAKINATGSGTLSEDTQYLLERSLSIWESTGGVFDITIYPIMDEWGFTSGNYQVPEKETLTSLLDLVDASQIEFDSTASTISFAKEGMKIDFGGIAKGYTSSRLMELFRDCGIESALVNLGGNVQALGNKVDGTAWRVGIQDPNDESAYIGGVSITDKAVITSGGYERYFEEDGVRYHHIIDPSTGYPADSDVCSVTIVSDDGTLADGLSTSLFIMGLDKATDYWRENSDQFDAILMTDDGDIYVTEGIEEQFFSDRSFQVIKKAE